MGTEQGMALHYTVQGMALHYTVQGMALHYTVQGIALHYTVQGMALHYTVQGIALQGTTGSTTLTYNLYGSDSIQALGLKGTNNATRSRIQYKTNITRSRTA